MANEKLADELAAIDARLRAVPTQSECSRAVNDLLAFMDKHIPAILAALRREQGEGVEQEIAQRDAAEEALSSAYEAVVGRPVEWNNLFGYADALAEIRAAIRALSAAEGKGLR